MNTDWTLSSPERDCKVFKFVSRMIYHYPIWDIGRVGVYESLLH